MGLYNDLTTDLKEAFDGDLADAVQVLTLVAVDVNGSGYDTSEGFVNRVADNFVTRGVASVVSNSMVDGEVIRTTDTQFVILHAEMLSNVDGVISFYSPKIADQVIDSSGVVYDLNSVILDPASASWLLVGRAV